MAGAAAVPVSVARSGANWFVKPHGACGVSICGGVREFVLLQKPPETTDIYFDLSEAGGMDSTFIGFLLSQVGRKGAGGRPAVHLLRPTAAVLEALTRMHVLSLFDVCQADPAPSIAYRDLALEAIGNEQVRDIVIDAHERLIGADARNAPSCAPVVEGFKADRARSRPGHAGGPHPPPEGLSSS